MTSQEACGLACNGQKRSVYQSFGSQLSHYGRYAAGVVQIVHVGISSRSQMTEVRSHSADLVECIKVKFHPCFVGYGQQVEHTVGGAAQGHIAGDGVSDRLFVDYVSGLDVFFDQVHDGHSGVFCQHYPLAGNGRYAPVARQSYAYGLAQAVHAVGRIHTGA